MKKLFRQFKEWFAGAEDLNEPYEAPQHDQVNPPFEHLSDFFAYCAYDDTTQLFTLETSNNKKNKSESLGVGFTLELNPLLGADDEMMHRLSTLLNFLPDETYMQIQMFASPDIRSFLRAYENIQSRRSDDDPAKPMFEELAQKRTQFWERSLKGVMFNGSAIRLRTFRCIISVVLPEVSFENRSSVDFAVNLKEKIISSLSTSGLYDKTWTPTDLIRWCRMLLNPIRLFTNQDIDSDPDWNELDFLKDQLVEGRTALKVLDSGKSLRFDCAGQYDGSLEDDHPIIARCLSVSEYPRQFHLNMMSALIGEAREANLNYSSPFLISMNLYKPNFDTKKNSLNIQNMRATQLMDSQLARILPEAKDRKQDLDILVQSYQDGGGALMLYHQIIVWERPEHIETAQSNAEAIWRTRGFKLHDDQFTQLSSYLSSLPMALNKYMVKEIGIQKRWTTKTLTNAVSLAPLVAEWGGNGPPVVGFFGQRGQAMGIDVFTNPAGNYNFVVVGASGSGKSFMVNDLVRNYLGMGVQVRIIDVGRSYEKFCEAIGGQYIEFTADGNIVIPPFQLVEEATADTIVSEDKEGVSDLELVSKIFMAMCSPSGELNEYQQSKLKRIIQRIWKQYRKEATVNHVYEALLTEKITNQDELDIEINRLADQMWEYTTEGPYGKFFNGQLTLNFNNDFVVLELEELKDKKGLQQVVMLLMIQKIMQEMYLDLDRSRKKLCIVDEAWQLLTDAVASFLGEGYRRARKYGCGFGTATQSVQDYYQTPEALAALVNSDMFFHLRSTEGSLRTLQEKQPFPVSEGVLAQIRSLKKNNHYSEVYIRSPMGSGVGRLISDPFSALLSSSHADDINAINRYRSQGKGIVEAIEHVLIDRGVV
ncbi:type IV secretion system protein TraC [Neisseria sp. Ec49-e6-T10]|uniref:type IV secretion system protein TraC n=1 Tax=Neisseria sp. Ec49-e6-T10 TaxID=3140744 RepID=UPI003EB805B8